MTIVQTYLGNTIESARRIRVETGNGIISTDVQNALEYIANNPPGIDPTPVTGSPFIVTKFDTVLFVDTTAGPVTIILPAGAARGNAPLLVKDVGGMASTNNITIQPDGVETVDGLTPWVIAMDFGGVNLAAKNIGGWTVLP